jgi:hypothetical protein
VGTCCWASPSSAALQVCRWQCGAGRFPGASAEAVLLCGVRWARCSWACYVQSRWASTAPTCGRRGVGRAHAAGLQSRWRTGWPWWIVRWVRGSRELLYGAARRQGGRADKSGTAVRMEDCGQSSVNGCVDFLKASAGTALSRPARNQYQYDWCNDGPWAERCKERYAALCWN